MTKEELEELDDEELVEMWNDYCEKSNRGGEGIHANKIYHMDDLDDVLGKMWPSDLFDTIDFNRFSEGDSYFGYNDYGYIESFDTPSDVIDEEAILEWYNANLT